jgi:predicted transcriptional regulator
MTDQSVRYICTIAFYTRLRMYNQESKPPSLDYIFKRISDEKTLTLFHSIAISDGDRYISLKEMNLTTKQYYSRIAGLTNAGLIKRHKGKYSLTLLGKVFYDSQMMIGEALNDYWKLKAIESIEMSSGATLPEWELAQLINALLDNHQIKDILMKSISDCTAKESRLLTESPVSY